jgi:hypothetical protein
MTSTESTATPAAPQKTKVEKAQSWLALVSTGLGIAGALGTGFVWVATTFFTGEVTVQPDKELPSFVMKVVDKKGQQSTYYNRTVTLMPGDYHLEFGVPDKKPMQHADAHVNLFKTTLIPYAVPAEFTADDQPKQDEESKKKWWQFWKRSK